MACQHELGCILCGSSAPYDAPLIEVGWEILEIAKTYHEQALSARGVGTPGGLEHMGDVWRLLLKWEAQLKTVG